MHVRTPDFGGTWIPVFNSDQARSDREATSEVYWPVSISRSDLVVVVCSEQRPHPSVLPAPVLSTLPLRAPTVPTGVSGDGGGVDAEEEFVRAGGQLACLRARQQQVSGLGERGSRRALYVWDIV